MNHLGERLLEEDGSHFTRTSKIVFHQRMKNGNKNSEEPHIKGLCIVKRSNIAEVGLLNH